MLTHQDLSHISACDVEPSSVPKAVFLWGLPSLQGNPKTPKGLVAEMALMTEVWPNSAAESSWRGRMAPSHPSLRGELFLLLFVHLQQMKTIVGVKMLKCGAHPNLGVPRYCRKRNGYFALNNSTLRCLLARKVERVLCAPWRIDSAPFSQWIFLKERGLARQWGWPTGAPTEIPTEIFLASSQGTLF